MMNKEMTRFLLEELSDGADGETRAGLMHALEFAVADDLSIGIVHLQRVQQCKESSFLGRGAGVGSTAFLIETTLVADADRVSVVVACVGTDH